jgi:hypothetical protein
MVHGASSQDIRKERFNLRKAILLAVVSLVAAASLVIVPAAVAGPLAVTNSGTCHSHPWTLTLSHDNARIEADYKLRSLRTGSTWRVVMKDNGVRFFRGTRTAGADHHIEVDKFAHNQSGTDKITVRARNLATGTICRASASIS